jgi:hypothetical protein
MTSPDDPAGTESAITTGFQRENPSDNVPTQRKSKAIGTDSASIQDTEPLQAEDDCDASVLLKKETLPVLLPKWLGFRNLFFMLIGFGVIALSVILIGPQLRSSHHVRVPPAAITPSEPSLREIKTSIQNPPKAMLLITEFRTGEIQELREFVGVSFSNYIFQSCSTVSHGCRITRRRLFINITHERLPSSTGNFLR